MVMVYSAKCYNLPHSTAKKMKFSIKNFFSKCDQVRRNLWIFMENFIFCTVQYFRSKCLLLLSFVILIFVLSFLSLFALSLILELVDISSVEFYKEFFFLLNYEFTAI